MKKLSIFLVLVLMGVAAHAQKKETRNVSDFDYISFSVNGDLTIIQGSKNEVILEGDEETLDEIETTVSGSTLKIKSKSSSWWGWSSSKRIKATVTLKDFTGVSVSGSGKVVSQGTLKGENVELGVSGSGDMDLSLKAADIDCGISGSGSITLNGSGRTGSLSISGSGELDAGEYQIETMKIRISGSGDATIYATKEIDSSISGSGTVRYKGDPDKISNHSSGSGKLRKL